MRVGNMTPEIVAFREFIKNSMDVLSTDFDDSKPYLLGKGHIGNAYWKQKKEY